jgi:hypothetical protein
VSGFTVTHLHEIPTRDLRIPIRDHFGIAAFGVNAYLADEAGSVISEHTETWSRHQELYVVVEGHATFTVDGEEVDAPAGTLVFIGDPAMRRSAVQKGAGTAVLAVGARPGHAFEITPLGRCVGGEPGGDSGISPGKTRTSSLFSRTRRSRRCSVTPGELRRRAPRFGSC